MTKPTIVVCPSCNNHIQISPDTPTSATLLSDWKVRLILAAEHARELKQPPGMLVTFDGDYMNIFNLLRAGRVAMRK